MKRLTPLLLIPLLAAGCTHTLKITNEKKFEPVGSKPANPVTVGFSPVGRDRLLNAAVKEAKRDGSIKDAREDFKPGGDFRPDYVCHLSSDVKFKAAGQNFFITFPGFIVFTHALVGFKYTAEITTHSTVRGTDGQTISQDDIATPYDFRHCSFARGAAAGCFGWLMPGYGAASIVPGLIFASSFDKRATSEFMEKVEPSYSRYVASRILEQLNKAQSARGASPTPVTGAHAGEPTMPNGAGAVEPALDGEYAVYVMKVDGNEIGQPDVSVKELPNDVRQTLNLMSQTGRVPSEELLENVLIALGATPGEFFGQLDKVEIFSQVEDRLVHLSKGPSADLPVRQ